MTETGKAVIQLLTEEKIPFSVYEHEPVYTIEEMLQVGLPDPDAIAKNLFVRDDKKKNYYLLVIREEKHADLKQIQQNQYALYHGMMQVKNNIDSFSLALS